MTTKPGQGNIMAQLDERWRAAITPALGFAQYGELLEALPAERARRLST